LGELPFNVIDG